MPDYKALDPGAKTTLPETGEYQARLEKAFLNDYDNVVTEWSSDGLWWESRNRFEGKGLEYMNEFLDGLGLDRARIAREDSDEYFNSALAEIQGVLYHVRVVVNHGESRTFYNTYVDGPVAPVQSELGEVVEDLPAANGSDSPAKGGSVPFHHEVFEVER